MLLKRVLDITASILGLIILAPVMALICILIWADSGAPLLFSQERVGAGFRHFRILKFRTMKTVLGGPLVTVKGDARVTQVGRILRIFKLDELPQLWNVLRGDMSLVGPRPEVPEYVGMFRTRYEHILSVRPGITDIASVRFRDEEQLLARSEEPLREYVDRILPLKLDLADEYIERRSLSLDLLIVLKTLLAAFRPA